MIKERGVLTNAIEEERKYYIVKFGENRQKVHCWLFHRIIIILQFILNFKLNKDTSSTNEKLSRLYKNNTIDV